MSTPGDELKDVATELLGVFSIKSDGTYNEVTFTRVTEGAYNVSTSTVASGSTVTFTTYGVTTNYSKQEIDGTLVTDDDILLTVNNNGTAPAVGDVATLDSVDYRVVNVDKTRINGVDVIYECQLRI